MVAVGAGRVSTLSLPRWIGRIGVGNLVLTVVLSVAAVALVTSPDNSGGPVAVALVLLSVASLLLIRTHPGVAAAMLAAGALVVQLLAGPIVTCGALLPVMCAMAFQLGARPVRRGVAVATGIGLVATGVVEMLLDPALDASASVFIGGLCAGFLLGGLVLRSRAAMIDRLRRRNEELVRQRERNAELAVAADRARIGADLETAVRARVRAITAAAVYGQVHLAEPGGEQSGAALSEIERQGRETLLSMRAVVGALDEAPTVPSPGLAHLPGLLQDGVTWRVEGLARGLSPELDLSAYRIVEHLLQTVDRSPAAGVEVVVRFTDAGLQLQVDGSPRSSRDADRVATARASAAAEARAQILGGRTETRTPRGRRQVLVSLPIETEREGART